MRWDIFCRVIDNFGDAGVCWRLACALAARGQQVRLVIDDPSPLAWMAPAGQGGVEVCNWPGPSLPGDVAIEAFGCDPPAAFVAAMAAAEVPPVWINLEHLSAEPFVERSHGLPSPQRNGLTKWFFFPGFTAATGGLLREPGLIAARAAFDPAAWLAGLGLQRAAGERVASLFCYANPHIPALLRQLAGQPTLLLLTPGPAQVQAQQAQQVQQPLPGLRLVQLPRLTQRDFDHLLWACDLNFVRGEDSLVRATWAGAPFVWQAYPQHDGAHAAKVDALLALMQVPVDVAAYWRGWNADAARPLSVAPAWLPWRLAAAAWCDRLAGQSDLASRLHDFVLGKSRQAQTGSC